MTILKYRILRKVQRSGSSAPVNKMDLLKRHRINKTARAIKELVEAGLLKYKGNSETLLITSAGVDSIEEWGSVMRDRWITRTLAIIALIISIVALIKQ